VKNGVLTARWSDPKVRGGINAIVAKIAPDGKSYRGTRASDGMPISGSALVGSLNP
jgi:hypothetical protein